jgi:hypothetical protein
MMVLFQLISYITERIRIFNPSLRVARERYQQTKHNNRINFMNKYLILSTLIFSEFLFSQTKIDENVTVDFLNKPETFENVTKEAKLNAYYLNSKEESYVAMRVETFVNNELPQNTEALQKSYTILATEQLKSMSKKGMFLKDSTQIKLNNYIAYKLIFKGENSEEENGETIILYLNGISYFFIYSKVGSYNQLNKEKFFKSIKINNPENLKQIEEPYNYWVAIAKILLGGVFLFFILKFLKMEKKRNLIK